MKFSKISVCLDMKGCPNRCKHCWIGHLPNNNLQKEDLEFVAKSFAPYTDTLEVFSWFREPDYSDDYQELWEIEKKLCKNTLPKRFELLSFYRINRDPHYLKWAYDLGVRKCQLTFFGLEKNTDYYVGRSGAFKELINATNLLIENKIAPRYQVFVNKQSISDINNFIELTKEMKLKERCLDIGQEFTLFIHQGTCDGENELLYDIRITDEDLKYIPSEYLIFDLGKKESDLYQELINDHSTRNIVNNEPVFYVTSDFSVYPNYTNIAKPWCLGNLKKDSIEQILFNYQNNLSLAQNTSINVPFSELVKKSGNPNSRRLFDTDDYIIYLLNKYLKSLY
ncbi:MAG TPA: hypothetical protein VIK84_00475 [Haloplasmataceae bacterium]